MQRHGSVVVGAGLWTRSPGTKLPSWIQAGSQTLSYWDKTSWTRNFSALGSLVPTFYFFSLLTHGENHFMFCTNLGTHPQIKGL
jgi:hypothetical protein